MMRTLGFDDSRPDRLSYDVDNARCCVSVERKYNLPTSGLFRRTTFEPNSSDFKTTNPCVCMRMCLCVEETESRLGAQNSRNFFL